MLAPPPAGAESVRRWYAAVGDFTPTAGGRLLLLFSGFSAAPPAAPAVPRRAREGLGCRETFADVEPGRDPGRCGDSEDQLSAPRGRPPFHGGWFGLLPARGKVSPAAGLRRIAAPRLGAGGMAVLDGWCALRNFHNPTHPVYAVLCVRVPPHIRHTRTVRDTTQSQTYSVPLHKWPARTAQI